MYCNEHKKAGMVNVTEKRKCKEIGCFKQPAFNKPGESKAMYCKEHKKDGMVDGTNDV